MDEDPEETPVNMLTGLEEALRRDPHFGPALKASDDVEKAVDEVLDCVDLSVCFSPVVQRPGQQLEDAVEVGYRARGGKKYVFREPYRIVSASDLKRMRARYLILRGRKCQPELDRVFGKRVFGKTPA